MFLLNKFLISIFIASVYAEDVCKSLDGNRVCVPIRQCESVLGHIAESLFTSPIIRRLQKITCGFEGTDPMVCCRKSDLNKKIDKIDNTNENTKISFKSKYSALPNIEECGKSSITFSDYIIGGETPALGSIPWIARIGYKEPDSAKFEYFCGGSLITSNTVLTAAHCIFSLVPNRFSVQLGEHDTRINPEYSPELRMKSYLMTYSVEQIIIHPDYNDTTKQNDIALIRLVRDVTFTPFIKPICLPIEEKYGITDFNFGIRSTESDNPKSLPMADVAGFGKISNDKNVGSEILQCTQVPIISNRQCQQIYEQKTVITQSQLCAGGVSGKDSCDGDSGGGLSHYDEKTKRHYQVGIVSFGPTICGSGGYPGIYTRIHSYLDWILSMVEEKN